MTQYYISCKESRIEHNRSFYSSFSLGPFDNGQSLTIANALRRTLLSDLKGTAIVSIQIEGVLHEYSSLDGVKDSVLDILLNFKEIILKKCFPGKNINHPTKNMGSSNTSSFYPQIGYLQVQGPGIVKAADLKLPPFIQVVDPEQYIATLENNAFLNIRFFIAEGQNYLTKQNRSPIVNIETKQKSPKSLTSNKEKRKVFLRKIKKLTNGNFDQSQKSVFFPDSSKYYGNFTNSNPLSIDSVFAPVNKVNYIIENSEHKLVEKSMIFSHEINQLLNFLQPVENSSLSPYSEFLKNSFQSEVKLPSLFEESQIHEILELKKELSSLNNIIIGTVKQNSKQNIVLEIWTNGSIHPKEALYQGLKQLIHTLSALYMIPDNRISLLSLKSLLKQTTENISLAKTSSHLTKQTQLAPLNSNNFSSVYTRLNQKVLTKS